MNNENRQFKLQPLQKMIFEGLVRGKSIKQLSQETGRSVDLLSSQKAIALRENGYATTFQAIYDMTKAGVL